jgi:rubrerythrin
LPISKPKGCQYCGNEVVRVHRTFFEKFTHRYVYSCLVCGERQSPGSFLILDRNAHAICPSCGTGRISRRKEPDLIDPFFRSFKGSIARLLGGQLYRCRYCRIQFYDRRPLQAEKNEAAAALQHQGRQPEA